MRMRPVFPGRRLLSLRIADEAESWRRAGFLIETSNLSPFPFVRIGSIVLNLVGPTAIDDDGHIMRNIVGWTWETNAAHGGDMVFKMDGLAMTLVSARDEERLPTVEVLESRDNKLFIEPPAQHPNKVTNIENIVIFTPNIAFTVEGFTYFGWKPVKQKDVKGRRMVLFKVGDVGIELVGPAIDYPLPKFKPGFNPNHPDLRPWDSIKGGPQEEKVAKEIRAYTGQYAKFWGITFVCEDPASARKNIGRFAGEDRPALQGGGRRFFVLDKAAETSVNIAFISAHNEEHSGSKAHL
ncbi:hypothetical protein HDU67_002152 [Dinochytrium kinnereticum]|nr:hypothetical protein HDU67_002152 [Dinochytrium kinnereticum]